MKQDIISERIEIPKGITVSIGSGNWVSVKGPKGEIKKHMLNAFVRVALEGNTIVIESKNASRRQKKLIYTFKAHVNNMFKGVVTPWVYKMKICAGHFPMNVAIQGDKLIVKNFLGEKVPRIVKLKSGAKVVLQDRDITVESADKERAGNVASDIEQLMRITGGRDLRKFQDGIYITSKAGKEVAK